MFQISHFSLSQSQSQCLSPFLWLNIILAFFFPLLKGVLKLDMMKESSLLHAELHRTCHVWWQRAANERFLVTSGGEGGTRSCLALTADDEEDVYVKVASSDEECPLGDVDVREVWSFNMTRESEIN